MRRSSCVMVFSCLVDESATRSIASSVASMGLSLSSGSRCTCVEALSRMDRSGPAEASSSSFGDGVLMTAWHSHSVNTWIVRQLLRPGRGMKDSS